MKGKIISTLNKKNIALILLIILVILSAFFSFYKKNMEKGKACFKDFCFNVDLAVSFKDKEKGLMMRESMGTNEGMLFIYEKEGLYGFWMKNTKIPLDIIWINAENEVVFINQNTLPCNQQQCPIIDPGKNAKYVLEINAGTAEKTGIKSGDKIDLIF